MLNHTHHQPILWVSRLGQVVASLSILSIAAYPAVADSLVVPDDTLGTERSVVTDIDAVTQQIEGGATRGTNLFHSFLEFNVAEGHSLYFANPTGIDTILSRVTGGNPSEILGRLGVLGNADLFLANPNGIVFGEHASLDVNGSFYAMTAAAIPLGDGLFSAVEPQNNSLLSVRPDAVFANYLTYSSGDITNNGDLTVGVGQTLALFGNTALNSGSLTAPGGVVQVLGRRVGLIDQATIDVSSITGGGTVLIGGDYQGQGTVPNAERTFVGPEVNINANALGVGNGGRVIVWADEATHFAGTINTQGGLQGGNGGFVEVSGAESLTFTGKVDTHALSGEAGRLLLDPTNIIIANTVPAGFTTVGLGDAVLADFLYAETENPAQNSHIFPEIIVSLLASNDLVLEATDMISVNDNVNVNSNNNLTLRASTIEINSASLVQSGGGNIALETPQASGSSVLLDGGQLIAFRLFGNSLDRGDINITTHDLRVQNGAFLGTIAFGTSNAGQVRIDATGDIVVDGVGSSLGSLVFLNALGDSGELVITTDNLSVLNGAVVGTATLGRGNSGQVRINAIGDIVADANGMDAGLGGFGLGDLASGLGSGVGPGATGNSGDVAITAANLFVFDDARVSSSTDGVGSSGRLIIDVTEDILLDGGFIASQVGENATGNASGMTITSTNLFVLNESEVNATIFGRGNSGLVQITATEEVVVADSSINSAIVVNPNAGGSSGGLSITTTNLLLNLGRIFTSTGGQGDAGPIILQSNNDTDLNISLLSAGAPIAAVTGTQGRGGDLTIRTAGNLTIQGMGNLTVESGVDTGSVGIDPANAGPAGNINVSARSVILDGGVELSAQTASNQGGGNINFSVEDAIILRRGSFINAESTNAVSGGGNIDIDANLVIAIPNENSDIIANAVGGTGGRIDIDAIGIYGFTEQSGFTTDELRANGTSDISASSQFGPQGIVNLSSLITDPNQGLDALEDGFINPEDLISTSCIARGSNAEGAFIVTGTDGLPQRPNDISASTFPATTVESIPTETAQLPIWQAGDPIVEPDGAYVVADGRVLLSRECR